MIWPASRIRGDGSSGFEGPVPDDAKNFKNSLVIRHFFIFRKLFLFQ